jgi:hypothetical protein
MNAGMRQELAELQAQGANLIDADDTESALRGAVLAWRLTGLVGRAAEQLGGLLGAVTGWQQANEPVFVGCRLGEDFLRSAPSNPREVLAGFTSPRRVRRLLSYPEPSSLVRMLSNPEIRALDRRLRRSTQDAAAAFARAAAAMTDENHRTFVRWKHAVSITSPRLVPIWIREGLDDALRAQIKAGITAGFAIIDLERRADAEPKVIVWTDTHARARQMVSLMGDLLALTDLVLASVLYWGDPRIRAIPLYESQKSLQHEILSSKLAKQHYRRRLATRAFELAALDEDDGAPSALDA